MGVVDPGCKSAKGNALGAIIRGDLSGFAMAFEYRPKLVSIAKNHRQQGACAAHADIVIRTRMAVDQRIG